MDNDIAVCAERSSLFGADNIQRCETGDTSQSRKHRNMPKPIAPNQMQQFLRLCNYVRKLVFDYAPLTAPFLTALKSHTNENKITWTDERARAFRELKKAIYK